MLAEQRQREGKSARKPPGSRPAAPPSGQRPEHAQALGHASGSAHGPSAHGGTRGRSGWARGQMGKGEEAGTPGAAPAAPRPGGCGASGRLRVAANASRVHAGFAVARLRLLGVQGRPGPGPCPRLRVRTGRPTRAGGPAGELRRIFERPPQTVQSPQMGTERLPCPPGRWQRRQNRLRRLPPSPPARTPGGQGALRAAARRCQVAAGSRASQESQAHEARP